MLVKFARSTHKGVKKISFDTKWLPRAKNIKEDGFSCYSKLGRYREIYVPPLLSLQVAWDIQLEFISHRTDKPAKTWYIFIIQLGLHLNGGKG